MRSFWFGASRCVVSDLGFRFQGFGLRSLATGVVIFGFRLWVSSLGV